MPDFVTVMMSFLIRLFLACFLFGLFFTYFGAEAQSPRVFVGTTFPLILEADDRGRPVGVSVDILERISEITGEEIEIRILPWARAMAMVKRAHATGLIGPYKSEERETFLDFSAVHFYEDRMIFLQKKKYKPFWNGDFTALQDMRILSVKAWAYGPAFDQSRRFLDIVETVDPRNALKILHSERVELLAYNERNAKADIARETFEDEIIICEPAFAEARGYFAFPKEGGDKEFEKRFDDALLQLLQSGEIKKINARYDLGFQNE